MSNKEANMKLFALSSNQPLANKIAKALNTELADLTISHFKDGEIIVSIEESIRGDHIYVIQSINDPVNDRLMEVMIMIDALRRASAKSINLVLPYFAYGRQDRKTKSREPITAKLLANMLQMAGADRVITLDLHEPQLEGFFDITVDHIIGDQILAQYYQDHGFLNKKLVVVSPDHGGVKRARHLAELLDAPIAIIDQRTTSDGNREILNVVGDIKGRTAIIVDDIIDTGITSATISVEMLAKGATEVYTCATHGVLSDESLQRLEEAPLEGILLTDSVLIPEEKILDKMDIVSVSDLIAESIYRIYHNYSIDELFEE
ncbi:ribose-phosphate diphosphokinase [Hutsoniella sourekii]|uniref:ribose-phosphate diphosphokinase n=1 Tax=Hutsoniella sourekii TaxID=87650 RepID=UPI00048489FA|nr:ribose-phosphate pyrophosphokinase [Hutsoniella sourekii]